MPPKNWVQVKLEDETNGKLQELVNEINRDRMDLGLVKTNRDLVGMATVLRDFIEEAMITGAIETFAERYKRHEKQEA